MNTERFYPAPELEKKLRELSPTIQWTVMYDSWSDRYTILAGKDNRYETYTLVGRYKHDATALGLVVGEIHYRLRMRTWYRGSGE